MDVKKESFFINNYNDPRECQYRLKTQTRIDVENVIRDCRRKFSGFKEDNKTNTDNVNKTIRKRRPIAKVINEDKEENVDKTDNKNDKLERLVTIFNKNQEEKNDAYTYDEMRQMHELLQHLDDRFLSKHFYEFLEYESNLTYVPPERKNQELEKNLRTLRVKNALADYNEMSKGVDRVVNKRAKGFGYAGSKDAPTLAEEMRKMRGILFQATESKLAIIGTFFGMYFALPYFYPLPMHLRILISFLVSVPVIVADLYNLFKLI